MSDELKHLVLGSEEADATIESYINIGCPFCSTYIRVIDGIFSPYIESGKVKHVIKHVDRTNGTLLKGTVAGTYLNYDEPEEAYKDMKEFLETRPEWKASFEEALMKMEGMHHVEQVAQGGRKGEIMVGTTYSGGRMV